MLVPSRDPLRLRHTWRSGSSRVHVCAQYSPQTCCSWNRTSSPYERFRQHMAGVGGFQRLKRLAQSDSSRVSALTSSRRVKRDTGPQVRPAGVRHTGFSGVPLLQKKHPRLEHLTFPDSELPASLSQAQSHRTLSSSACEERGIHLLNPDRRKREWVAVLQNDAHNHTVPYPMKKPLGQTTSESEAGSSNLDRKTDLEHGHDQPQQQESRPQKKKPRECSNHGRITEPQEVKLYLYIAYNMTPVGESTPSVHGGNSRSVDVPVLCQSLHQCTRDEQNTIQYCEKNGTLRNRRAQNTPVFAAMAPRCGEKNGLLQLETASQET